MNTMVHIPLEMAKAIEAHAVVRCGPSDWLDDRWLTLLRHQIIGTPAQAEQEDFYCIVSLKHTKHFDHVVFWGENQSGYSWTTGQSMGLYTREAASRHNNGVDSIAVPLSVVRILTTEAPMAREGIRLYDQEGGVLNNNILNWSHLIVNRLDGDLLNRSSETAVRTLPIR